MALTHRLVAVSWTMPPVVLPRSIQIARTLKTLSKRGWTCSIITPPVDALSHPTLDKEFAGNYAGYYEQIIVEPREEKQASSPWLRYLRKLFPPPDIREANWIRRASRQAIRTIGPDKSVFVSFAQPWINHRVGLEVKRLRPKQAWLAHFSDPWTDSLYYSPDHPELDAWRAQERSVIEKCDAVVFVTKETADLVMSKYPTEWRNKVHVVPHGIDYDLLVGLGTSKASQPETGLRVVYTGNIYSGHREPTYLLRTLDRLHRQTDLEGRLRFDFFGHAPQSFCEAVNQLGLEKIVGVHAPISYLESLKRMGEADMLLLIDALAEKNVFLPSKTVDYLMMDKPILGLTPNDGASARILRETGHYVVDPRDEAALVSTLDNMLTFPSRSFTPTQAQSAARATFEISHTTEIFEQALFAAQKG